MHPNSGDHTAALTDPAAIARNAKASLHTLKEAYSTRDPWDRDVEFHRQNTRRHFLQLILCFPYAPQTQQFDNPVWIETSHAFIAIYRSRIATLERNIAAKAEKPGTSNANKSGPVELRKLVQRFRQFLADEERFWIGFILRFTRSFALHEAKPHLNVLNLARHSEDLSMRRSTFPEEGIPTPPPPGQRDKKIMVLVKALISLGDLARYREQYNESGGRPKAGHDDVPPRWATKATRKPGDWVPRPRNYNRALACYVQARLLFPDAGNASHQLAIVASYQSDVFASILHYYRSLCVKYPFQMALENLDRTLAKTLETRESSESRPPNDQDAPREVADRFKKDVTILHALWRSEKPDRERLGVQTEYILTRFNKLVSERLLPIGLVVKIFTAALGALYTLRMYRRGSPALKAQSKSNGSMVQGDGKKGEPSEMESIVLTHCLELLLGLILVSMPPLIEEETKPASSNTAERIPVALRRSLQTLRVGVKWLRSNLDYLARASGPSRTTPALTQVLSQFWEALAQFVTILKRVFPAEELQDIAMVPLEEDIELSGFSPMRGSLNSTTGSLGEAHPNDEFLLRIRDIILDAVLISESNSTPLRHSEGVFSTENGHENATALAYMRRKSSIGETGALYSEGSGPSMEVSQNRIVPQLDTNTNESKSESGDFDEGGSVSTRTEDDPVSLAMKVSLDQASVGIPEDEILEDEDDQILYNPQNSRLWAPLEHDYASSPSIQRSNHGVSSLQLESPFSAPVAGLTTNPLAALQNFQTNTTRPQQILQADGPGVIGSGIPRNGSFNYSFGHDNEYPNHVPETPIQRYADASVSTPRMFANINHGHSHSQSFSGPLPRTTHSPPRLGAHGISLQHPTNMNQMSPLTLVSPVGPGDTHYDLRLIGPPNGGSHYQPTTHNRSQSLATAGPSAGRLGMGVANTPGPKTAQDLLAKVLSGNNRAPSMHLTSVGNGGDNIPPNRGAGHPEVNGLSHSGPTIGGAGGGLGYGSSIWSSR